MTLRALVVFESMFGNTEKVAAAVAHGLQLEGIDTGLVEVHAAPATLSPEVDLLVVGGPTHGFSMSRVSTREDAVRQGAPAERATLGLREWLEAVQFDAAGVPALATFDTRVTKVRWLPQAAAASAARAGRHRGLEAGGQADRLPGRRHPRATRRAGARACGCVGAPARRPAGGSAGGERRDDGYGPSVT